MTITNIADNAQTLINLNLMLADRDLMPLEKVQFNVRQILRAASESFIRSLPELSESDRSRFRMQTVNAIAEENGQRYELPEMPEVTADEIADSLFPVVNEDRSVSWEARNSGEAIALLEPINASDAFIALKENIMNLLSEKMVASMRSTGTALTPSEVTILDGFARWVSRGDMTLTYAELKAYEMHGEDAVSYLRNRIATGA